MSKQPARNAAPVPRVGVGVIVEREGRVLLVRRQNAHGAGTWSTPGGHLEYGETPEACAARELFEETGVEMRGARWRGVTNDFFAGEGKHYITLWIEGAYADGEARVNAPDELTQVGWYDWAVLPQPLFLPLENLVRGRCYPPEARKGADSGRGN